ncbi:MAG: hypothetical protein HY000_07005 [Planctomycetes bacterium]|nr:hypothetical protein [Planctomycetota bacterium]
MALVPEAESIPHYVPCHVFIALSPVRNILQGSALMKGPIRYHRPLGTSSRHSSLIEAPSMTRALLPLLLVLFVVSFFGAAFPHATSAQPIGAKNPFRSYNISGVNYGSQQWEKSHRGKAKTSSSRKSGRVFLRRR